MAQSATATANLKATDQMDLILATEGVAQTVNTNMETGNQKLSPTKYGWQCFQSRNAKPRR